MKILCSRSAIEAIQRTLLAWYRAHARDLPWRRTRDPYRIWLSEVMLQQTRVETVVGYYTRWVAALPTVEVLAAADEDQVLKLWEGLGYYRRARNFHRAAKVVVVERAGRLPTDAKTWLTLPGVGRYTAGAIASIVFGEPVPVLDGNVKRVLSRLFRIESSIDDKVTIDALWDVAARLVPGDAAGDFNQALMELGARVCVPRRPSCLVCPLADPCRARRAGVQEKLPVRKAKRPVPYRDDVAALVSRGGRYLLAKRPEGLLGGLWEFPGGPVAEDETQSSALVRNLKDRLGVDSAVGALRGQVRHAFTHRRVTYHLYNVRLVGGTPAPRFHTELRWARRAEWDDMALPVAMQRLIALL